MTIEKTTFNGIKYTVRKEPKDDMVDHDMYIVSCKKTLKYAYVRERSGGKSWSVQVWQNPRNLTESHKKIKNCGTFKSKSLAFNTARDQVIR